jgi:hypothetical protein
MKIGDLIKHTPSGAIGMVTSKLYGEGVYIHVYWVTAGRFNDGIGYISVIETKNIEVINESR